MISRQSAILYFCIMTAACIYSTGTCNGGDGKSEQGQVDDVMKANTVDIVSTADALHAEYKANKDAADRKYKNKVIEVTGRVREVERGVISFYPSISFELTGKLSETSVKAEFARGAGSQLDQVSKGQRITVRGRCNGVVLMIVELVDCDVR